MGEYAQFTPAVQQALFKQYMRVPDPAKAHAKLSASGSERWLGCPGSVKLSEGIPGVDNEHSIRGTNTHTLLQFILENEKYKWLLMQPAAKAFKAHIDFDEEMYQAALFAANFVKAEKLELERRTGNPAHLMVEQKVELEGVGFGTADIILYQHFGVLHVMDFKNGKHPVECQDSTQGLYYAHAALDLHGWDFKEVWITIIQPNARHKDGPTRTWKTTLKRLEEAGERFRRGAKATRKPNAALVVDAKWCWFCPARSICPEHLKGKETKIMDRFTKPERGDEDENKKESRSKKEASKKIKSFCDTF